MRVGPTAIAGLALFAGACAHTRPVAPERLSQVTCTAKGWAARAEIQCALPPELPAQRVRVTEVDAQRMRIVLVVEESDERAAKVLGADAAVSVQVPKPGTYGIVFAGDERTVQTVDVQPQLKSDDQIDTFSEVYGSAGAAR